MSITPIFNKPPQLVLPILLPLSQLHPISNFNLLNQSYRNVLVATSRSGSIVLAKASPFMFNLLLVVGVAFFEGGY